MARISFDFADLRLGKHLALARGEGRHHVDGFLRSLLAERRDVLPSMAMSSAGVWSTPPPRPRSNAGSLERRAWRRYRRDDRGSASRRREGGRKRRSKPSSFSPNRAMSVKPSAPARTARSDKRSDLIERIHHLSSLPTVRQIFEMIQKSSRLKTRRNHRVQSFHRPAPPIELMEADRFSSSSLCHAILHPIALGVKASSIAIEDVPRWFGPRINEGRVSMRDNRVKLIGWGRTGLTQDMSKEASRGRPRSEHILRSRLSPNFAQRTRGGARKEISREQGKGREHARSFRRRAA